MKAQITFLSLITFLLAAQVVTPAQADGGKKIASCKVSSPGNGDPSAVFVYQSTTQAKAFNVILIGLNGNKALPSQESEFSPDGKTLTLRVANFLIITVVKGSQTQGSVGVELGAPPTPMTCDANW